MATAMAAMRGLVGCVAIPLIQAPRAVVGSVALLCVAVLVGIRIAFYDVYAQG